MSEAFKARKEHHEMIDRGLSEEQRLMRETCRGFVNDW